jgi:pimeloyl-ACP methyl ester carboxylesterase
MDLDRMADVPASDPAWRHATAADADALEMHYVRWGDGSPQVLLLHGWPGFWYDWRRILPELAQFTAVVAPDLRGFGASAKPDWPAQNAYSAGAQAKSILALLDQLSVERIVLAGYDIGSRVAQTLAQLDPDRIQALVLAAPVYPGFGTRPLEPAAQAERWYQHFHQLSQADALIGHDPETVRLYLAHFYDHWLGRKNALRPAEFEEIVKVYAQPGAVRGSIAWYRSGSGSAQLALAQAAGTAVPAPSITQPTQVLWGEVDPILPAAWADRLSETFTQLLSVQILAGIGHFVPFEAPEAFVESIRSVL